MKWPWVRRAEYDQLYDRYTADIEIMFHQSEELKRLYLQLQGDKPVLVSQVASTWDDRPLTNWIG